MRFLPYMGSAPPAHSCNIAPTTRDLDPSHLPNTLEGRLRKKPSCPLPLENLHVTHILNTIFCYSLSLYLKGESLFVSFILTRGCVY